MVPSKSLSSKGERQRFAVLWKTKFRIWRTNIIFLTLSYKVILFWVTHERIAHSTSLVRGFPNQSHSWEDADFRWTKKSKREICYLSATRRHSIIPKRFPLPDSVLQLIWGFALSHFWMPDIYTKPPPDFRSLIPKFWNTSWRLALTSYIDPFMVCLQGHRAFCSKPDAIPGFSFQISDFQ